MTCMARRQKTWNLTDADTTRAQKRAKSNTNIKQNKNLPIKNETSSQSWSNTLNQDRPNVSRLRDIDVF